MSIKVTIKNNKEFILDKSVAFVSKTIKNFIEDMEIDEMKCDNIHENSFQRIIKFMEFHKDDIEEDQTTEKKPTFINGVIKDTTRKYEDQLDNDKKLIDDLVVPELLYLMEQIDYLSVRKMMDLCSLRIAFFMRDASTEKMRVLFDMKNDFTRKEEVDAKKKIEELMVF